jgi:hypothetical protein
MKIQDLRDDLAEMRYFKKSYLRKMSQQEAGGPMLPMPADPYAAPNPADQPMLPDGGSRYTDNPDGTVSPYFPAVETIRQIDAFLKWFNGGGAPPVSGSNSEPFMVDPGGGSDDWSSPEGGDPTSDGFGDFPPDITPEELERMLPNWLRLLNAGQIYFGPDGILRNNEGRPVLDQDGNVVTRDMLEFQAVEGGLPGPLILGILALLKRAGLRGMLPIPGDPDFPDTDRFFDPGGPLDPNRFRTQ